MMATPRLRMFAGPNGSGKSTIKAAVPEKLFGFYLNPDEIEKKVKNTGYLDIRDMKIHTSKQEVIDFFNDHPLIERTEHGDCICDVAYIEKGFIDFGNVGFDSYMSAILTDFLRKKFLANDQSFTFETVMSSPDKVAVLKKAQALGYKTYLYYVATKDPAIILPTLSYLFSSHLN